MITRLLSLIARVELQPLWRALHRISILGLGHMNSDPRFNGELRHLARWAKAVGRSRPVVFDIGANEGDFTASAIAALGDVDIHCFEPNPKTCARLMARFASDSRVHVNPVGISDAPGILPLYDYRHGVGSAHASFVAGTFVDIYPAETATVEVPLTTVDAYMAENHIARVDYVKVDVEGFEKNVFAGMAGAIAAGRVDLVQFEFNAHNAITGLSLYLIGLMLPGFEIRRILANGTVPVIGPRIVYNSRLEIFKYSNYVALRLGAEKRWWAS